MAKVTLQRVLAEIKNLESKLPGEIMTTKFIGVKIGTSQDISLDQMAKTVDSDLQSIVDRMQRLADLKAIRNYANATTEVVVNNTTMTIDEAIALKASLPLRQNLISTLRQQLANATFLIAKQDETIQQRVEAQLTALNSGTKKASEQEIGAIRNLVSPGLKATLVAPKDLQVKIDKMQKEVDNITLELDFTLSEANAKTEVEVNF